MTQDVQDTAEKQALSPYRGVQVLLHKASEQITLAAEAVVAGDKEARGLAVSEAVTILGVLQASLDKANGGEIAENLDALYDYMTRCLAGVALDEDPRALDEVQRLLGSIKSAWDAIAAEVEPV